MSYKETMKQEGHIILQNKDNGSIDGGAKGATVSIKVEKKDKETKVVVSARKMMLLPNPKIAKSLLYVISEKLIGE